MIRTLLLVMMIAGCCLPFASLAQVAVTFRVDMRHETVSPKGVHVTGNFQSEAGFPADWNPATTALTDANQDSVYEVTLNLPSGSYTYKYVNGNSWGDKSELPPAACSVPDGGGNNNRLFLVGNSALALTGVFDSCGATVNQPIEPKWWNNTVFYEVFVRSFYDSDADGKGDFQGLMEKLDYLNDGDPATTTDLGVTGLWLMPMMESPSYHGYDVTNYYATEPDYGSMSDFEAFLDSAHARGIRVVIDYVMNHTSSQHPWFTQSANNTGGYRDWYRWSATNPGGTGPWGQGIWHSRNSAWYYGLFWSGMPDLNYDKPEVKQEMFDIAEFWLDKGVDGFRLDAIKYLDENGTVLENTPENFQLLRDFRQVYKTANPEAFTVGEVWSPTADIVPYAQGDGMDVCFEFGLAGEIINGVNNADPLTVYNQMAVVQFAYKPLQYATFLTNHDQNRVFEAFGSDVSKMKLAASLYLTLPGIPFLYYGEEVGMIGSGVDENKRKPMQWANDQNAGFSPSTPWYAVNSNYPTYNVETMAANPASLLNHYKQLIHLRNARVALREGSYLPLKAGNSKIMAFGRVHATEALLVVANMGTASAGNFALSVDASGIQPGWYLAKEQLTGATLGSIQVSAHGKITSFLPNQSLAARQTWVIALEPDSTNGTQLAVHQPFEVVVFPNPARQTLSLKVETPVAGPLQAVLTDMAGREVMQFAVKQGITSVEVGLLVPGIYLLQVNGDGWQVTRRVAVE